MDASQDEVAYQPSGAGGVAPTPEPAEGPTPKAPQTCPNCGHVFGEAETECPDCARLIAAGILRPSQDDTTPQSGAAAEPDQLPTGVYWALWLGIAAIGVFTIAVCLILGMLPRHIDGWVQVANSGPDGHAVATIRPVTALGRLDPPVSFHLFAKDVAQRLYEACATRGMVAGQSGFPDPIRTTFDDVTKQLGAAPGSSGSATSAKSPLPPANRCLYCRLSYSGVIRRAVRGFEELPPPPIKAYGVEWGKPGKPGK